MFYQRLVNDGVDQETKAPVRPSPNVILQSRWEHLNPAISDIAAELTRTAFYDIYKEKRRNPQVADETTREMFDDHCVR